MIRAILKHHKAAIVLAGDTIVFFLALILTPVIRSGDQTFRQSITAHMPLHVALFLMWILTLYIVDLYTFTKFRSTWENAKLFALALTVNFFLTISVFYVFGSTFGLTPKTNLVIFTLLLGALDGLWRFSFPRIFVSKHRHLLILVGNSPRIQEIIAYAHKHPQAGYDTFHFSEWKSARAEIQKQTLRTSGELTIVIDNAIVEDKEANKGLYDLVPQHIEIRTLADFYERLFWRIPLEEAKEEWFIHELSESKIYDSGKRAFDVALACACIIITSPLLLAIACLVKATSEGPALYAQIRIGKDGKLFTLYKFRNMYHTLDKNPDRDGTVPTWWQKDDARVTPVGKFLRATHLDELGQLFNILKGEISFVGPRPERPEFVEKLKAEIPHYVMRSTITPGLTGWAQIKFRYARSVLDSREKFEYDLYYLKNRNLLLDLEIMAKTIQYIFVKQE